MLRLISPTSRASLTEDSDGTRLRSPSGECFERKDGVWRFFPEARRERLERFMREYQIVREREGRAKQTPEQLRGLPFGMESTAFSEYWAVRSRSYGALLSHVLVPLDRQSRRTLQVADLGAGNGWLSHRLSQLGFDVAAVDLLDNDWDGLGAHRHYPTEFVPVQADYDLLPFADAQLDLLIFNASFHYSEAYDVTLHEALRVLRPDGLLVIMDTPLFPSAEDGHQMIAEREREFQESYGFPSNALASEGFVTEDRLEALAETHGIEWERIEPFYGWRWHARPLRARLRRRRAPGRFYLIVGRRSASR